MSMSNRLGMGVATAGIWLGVGISTHAGYPEVSIFAMIATIAVWFFGALEKLAERSTERGRRFS